MTKRTALWEVVGYVALIGCVLGQIIVGYWYMFAQIVYLICNISMTVRCFAIHQQPADKVKNCVFTAITLGLIILRILA